MGQISDGFKLTIRFKLIKRYLKNVKPLSLCILLSMFGCSDNTTEKWMETKGSCVYESVTPPLRRVINYEDPELCKRQTTVKKKQQKRLRELIDKN